MNKFQKDKIFIFQGDNHVDNRGSISFINEFSFKNIKRFYQLENTKNVPVRAFHGHMKEAKYIYVVTGAILLCLIPLDNPVSPAKTAIVTKMVLRGKHMQIVYVPPGFANGFKILASHTKVMVFSTSTVQESIKDDYRYTSDYWGNEIWETAE